MRQGAWGVVGGDASRGNIGCAVWATWELLGAGVSDRVEQAAPVGPELTAKHGLLSEDFKQRKNVI